jgi:pimeloyl-ACP methyl ester carboxylesterase
VAIVHNAISDLVYDSLGLAARHLPPAVASMAATAAEDDPPLDEHPRAAELIAALNGIYGDELAARDNHLATTMAPRVGGRAVPLTRAALDAAYPRPTNRIAVFVHGLCQTEQSWRRPPRPSEHPDERWYGDRLAEDLGYTPIAIRYNTGLHISTNGKALDALLTGLVEAWPVPVRRVALIGHSMGGLVVRSACHYGGEWTRLVRQVVCLGSPHLGADLEKGVNAASWAMAKLRETRAVANFLNLRSDGIKDLRFGALREEDWQSADPDAMLRDHCGDVPFLPHARYHFVATSAAPTAVGKLVGDYLVRPASAAGRGRSRQVPFADEDGLVLTGLHHFDLLNHPRIYERLHEWLA